VIASVKIVLALAWTAVVVDVVAETAAAADGTVVAFDSVLTQPGETATIWAVAGLAASALLALALAVGSAWNDRVERRVARAVDARFARLASEDAALTKRRDQLSGRLADLHRRIESLARERAAHEDELSRQRHRVARLRELTRRSARELDPTWLGLGAPARDTALPDVAASSRAADALWRHRDDEVDTDGAIRLPDISTSEPEP
jgi:hypothetical protein